MGVYRFRMNYYAHHPGSFCFVQVVIPPSAILPALKGRLPVSHESERRRTRMAFLVQGLGYFFPPLCLTFYALDLGYLPPTDALSHHSPFLDPSPREKSTGDLLDDGVSV